MALVLGGRGFFTSCRASSSLSSLSLSFVRYRTKERERERDFERKRKRKRDLERERERTCHSTFKQDVFKREQSENEGQPQKKICGWFKFKHTHRQTRTQTHRQIHTGRDVMVILKKRKP